jgi:hypothetical protein
VIICGLCRKGQIQARQQARMSRPTNSPRRPATAFTVVCGYREAGTILGCPGCWVARSNGGDYLGTFLSQRAARRAIERHVEAQG